MTEPGRSSNEVEARLSGIAQRILGARATDDPEPPVERRNIVDATAALAAIDLATMSVDGVYNRAIPANAESWSHILACLMVAREYIEPLPGGLREDGTNGLADDLEEMVRRFRATGMMDWSLRGPGD